MARCPKRRLPSAGASPIVRFLWNESHGNWSGQETTESLVRSNSLAKSRREVGFAGRVYRHPTTATHVGRRRDGASDGQENAIGPRSSRRAQSAPASAIRLFGRSLLCAFLPWRMSGRNAGPRKKRTAAAEHRACRGCDPGEA